MLRPSRLLAVLLAAVTLAACDGSGPTTPPSDFAYAPLAAGQSLFASGPSTTGGDVAPGARRSGSSAPVTYGCYLSTPDLDVGGYRLDGTAIEFPQDVLDRAQGRSKTLAVQISSRTAYADTPRDTPVVLRVARCVVPDDPEAVALLGESLAQFQEADTTWEGQPANEPGNATARTSAAASMSEGCYQIVTTHYTEWCSNGICFVTVDFVEYGPVTCTGSGGGTRSDGPPSYDPPPGGGGTPSPGPDACDSDQLMPTADQNALGCEEEIFWDALDFIALAWSLYDFTNEPSWRNALFLGADAVGAALPIIPSLGTIRRGAKILSVGEAWGHYNKLKRARQSIGNFGLGVASRANSEIMGFAWVGEGYRIASDGILISQNGLKQYRPPSWKPDLNRYQSNFEWRHQPSGRWTSNGHLDISG